MNFHFETNLRDILMLRSLVIKLSFFVLVAIVSECAHATSVSVACHFVPTNHCNFSILITRESISHITSLGDLTVVVSTENLKLSDGVYRSFITLRGANSSAETELDLVVRNNSIKFIGDKVWNLETKTFDKLASISIKVAKLPFEIEHPQIPFAQIRISIWVEHREVAVSEGTMTPEGCWYGGVRCEPSSSSRVTGPTAHGAAGVM